MICPGEDANGDSPPVGYCCRQQAVLTHDEGGSVAGDRQGGERGERGCGLMLAAKLFALCQYSKTDFHMSFKFICAQA